MRIGLVSNFSKVQNVGCGKIENNGGSSTECNEIFKENTVELYSSRSEAVTYTSGGGYKGNLNKNVAKDDEVCDGKKIEFEKSNGFKRGNKIKLKQMMIFIPMG